MYSKGKWIRRESESIKMHLNCEYREISIGVWYEGEEIQKGRRYFSQHIMLDLPPVFFLS